MTSPRVLGRAFAAGALLLLPGCGRWPPIVETSRDVERLSVSEHSVRARSLADSDIPSLERLRELRDLDFYGGWGVEEARITDDGLERLADLDLPQLDTLALGCCERITDAGTAHILRMHTVTHLMLMGSPQVTDASLQNLATMKSLTYLDLRGCSGITDLGLQHLAKKTDWQWILLGGCRQVTADAVAGLQAALPNAKVRKDDMEWEQHQCR